MDELPRINWLEPESERDDLHHLSISLWMLQNQERQFGSAERLASHVETILATMPRSHTPIAERMDVANWITIAGHYAILAIYHFRSTICSIQALTGRCESLGGKVDTKAVQEALDRFHQDFPHFRELRDLVGHFQDKIFSPEKLEKHRPDDDAFWHGHMSGRTLIFTHDKKRVSQDITLAELAKLTELRRAVWAAFRKAASQ